MSKFLSSSKREERDRQDYPSSNNASRGPSRGSSFAPQGSYDPFAHKNRGKGHEDRQPVNNEPSSRGSGSSGRRTGGGSSSGGPRRMGGGSSGGGDGGSNKFLSASMQQSNDRFQDARRNTNDSRFGSSSSRFEDRNTSSMFSRAQNVIMIDGSDQDTSSNNSKKNKKTKSREAQEEENRRALEAKQQEEEEEARKQQEEEEALRKKEAMAADAALLKEREVEQARTVLGRVEQDNLKSMNGIKLFDLLSIKTNQEEDEEDDDDEFSHVQRTPISASSFLQALLELHPEAAKCQWARPKMFGNLILSLLSATLDDDDDDENDNDNTDNANDNESGDDQGEGQEQGQASVGNIVEEIRMVDVIVDWNAAHGFPSLQLTDKQGEEGEEGEEEEEEEADVITIPAVEAMMTCLLARGLVSTESFAIWREMTSNNSKAKTKTLMKTVNLMSFLDNVGYNEAESDDDYY